MRAAFSGSSPPSSSPPSPPTLKRFRSPRPMWDASGGPRESWSDFQLRGRHLHLQHQPNRSGRGIGPAFPELSSATRAVFALSSGVSPNNNQELVRFAPGSSISGFVFTDAQIHCEGGTFSVTGNTFQNSYRGIFVAFNSGHFDNNMINHPVRPGRDLRLSRLKLHLQQQRDHEYGKRRHSPGRLPRLGNPRQERDRKLRANRD